MQTNGNPVSAPRRAVGRAVVPSARLPAPVSNPIPVPSWFPGPGLTSAPDPIRPPEPPPVPGRVWGRATVLPPEPELEPGPVPEPEPEPAGTIARGTRFKLALLWSYVVSTGMYVNTALITFILAAILGPEEFGLLWMALVWITLGQILLQHGPTMAVIQQENITERHLDAAFWTTMIGAVIFTVLLAAAAPLWAAFTDLPELLPISLALCAIIPMYALNVIPEAVLRRQMRMKGIAIRYLAAGVISGVTAIACAVAGLGVWSLVVQQVGLTLIVTVTLWALIPWRPRLRRFGQELRDIRGTSAKTLLGAAGDFVVSRADILLMGPIFGPVVVGLFRFAVRIPEMVIDLTARGLRNMALPDLARRADDPAALADRLARLVRIAAVLSIPGLGVVVAAAEPFVLFIGAQWADAAPPLRLLCIAAAVQIVSALFMPALQAAQRPGLPAMMTWVSAALMTGAILVAAQVTAGSGIMDQLLAVATALIGVHTVLALVTGYLVFGRVLRISALPTLLAVVPSLLAALGAAAAGWAVLRLVGDGPPVLVQLLLTGTVATLVAGGLVLALDGQARIWLGMAVRKVRARRVGAA